MITEKIAQLSQHMADREVQYAEAYAKLQQKTKLYEKEKEYLGLKLRKALNDAHKQQVYYQDVEEKLSLVMNLLEERERNAADSIARLESELRTSKDRENDLRAELQHLHSTVSDLRSTIASSMVPLAAYEEIDTKYTTLQQSVGNSYVPKEEYQMLHTAYKNVLHRMETTMVLRGEYDALLAKHDLKLTEIESSTIDRSKYDDLQLRYTQLQDHVTKNMVPVSECNRLREEAEKYLRQNELFEESFSILEEEKRSAFSKVQECEQKIASLKSRVLLSNEEKASLEVKLKEKNVTIDTLETEISQLSTLLSDERDCKNRLLVENGAYAIRIAELQRSFQRSLDIARRATLPQADAVAPPQHDDESTGPDDWSGEFDFPSERSDDDLQACEDGLRKFHEKLKESIKNR